MNFMSALKHIVRVGTVTAIYDETGYLQVTFFDRDEEPRDVPMFSFIQEYNMPDIGDNVLCIFIPFAPEGFCLGKWFSHENVPFPNGNKRNIWYKQLRKKANVYFDDETETLTLNAKNIVINYENITYNGTKNNVNTENIIINYEDITYNGTTNNVNANIIHVGDTTQTGNTATSGTVNADVDVIANKVSLHNHTHGYMHGGLASGPDDTSAPNEGNS